MKTAHKYWEDGKQWLRIRDGSDEWDEPINEWTLTLDLINGGCFYTNSRTQEKIKGE